MGGYAWVTLATNDSYSLGALVLANSLKQVGTKQQLAVLITPGVTSAMRSKLQEVFNVVQEVNLLDSKDETNLRLLKRPELGITFTKLHCWRLTQFDKCVFLDADTLVLENCDELFDREELSAAPDIGWPDCFNSGVFVYRPSNDTYEKLVQFALDKGSFDGGDQGLLNLYFSDWAHKDISKHLPFIYNMASTACYSYLPAFKQFGANAKIIHFIGSSKPWLQYFDTEKQEVHPSQDLQHLKGLLQHWWNIFCSLIHANLSPEMAGIAGAFARLTLGTPRTAEQLALDDHLRRQGWEVGNIDYLGRDSFDNIWSKICETLSTGPEPIPTAAKEPTPPPSEEKPKPVEQPSVPATEVQTVPESTTAPQPTEPEPTKVDPPVSETATPVSEPPKPEETAKPVVPDTPTPETPSEPPKTETAPPKSEPEPEPPKSAPEPQPEVAQPAPEPPKPEPEPPKPEPAPEPAKSEAEPPKPEPPKPAEPEVPKTEAESPKQPEVPAQEVPAVTPESEPVQPVTPEVAKPAEPPAPSQESPKPEEPKVAESPKPDAQVPESVKVESQPEIVPESIQSAAAPEAPKAIAAPPAAESPKESPKPKGEEKKAAAPKEPKKSKDAPKAEATAPETAASDAPAQELASGPTPPPRKASGEKKKTATKTKK